MALKLTLIISFIALTSIGVSIIKGIGRLKVLGRLKGFEALCRVTFSYSRYNITVRRDPIITSGLNRNSLIFS
jgi:hypothetical protein